MDDLFENICPLCNLRKGVWGFFDDQKRCICFECYQKICPDEVPMPRSLFGFPVVIKEESWPDEIDEDNS